MKGHRMRVVMVALLGALTGLCVPTIGMAAVALLLLVVAPAHAQIASQYPKDVGIETDPRVIFSEKFAGTVAQIAARFNEVSITGTTVSTDVPSGAAVGAQSIQMGGASSQRLYKNLITGRDIVFWRYYIKYTGTADYGSVHSGVWGLGQNPASDFLPSTCCSLPTGSDRFYVGPEIGSGPGVDDAFDLYSGWMEMRPSGFAEPTNPACTGPGNQCYYGNVFVADNVLLTRDAWTLVEVMVKMNTTPTSTDGELRLWLNDVEIVSFGPGFPTGAWNNAVWTTGAGAPFPGFRFRSTTALGFNGLWVLYGGTANPSGIRVCCLVAATERVGPLSIVSLPGTPTNVQVTFLLSMLAVGLLVARRRIGQ